jgi:ribosomal protein L11 methyltransferase
MAFGTGTHETTQLCLQFLEAYLKPNMTVLDIGTGSGILAIAAIKMGAAFATGVDIEEEAIENAIENSELNHTTLKTDFIMGSLDAVPSRKYDLILANLNFPVLSEKSDDIVTFAGEHGLLIVSGVLGKDESRIMPILENLDLQCTESRFMNEWMALVARK